MCLVVFLAQGQAEIHDHGVLPLSLLSSGFPSSLPEQLREDLEFFPSTDHFLQHLQPLKSAFPKNLEFSAGLCVVWLEIRDSLNVFLMQK